MIRKSHGIAFAALALAASGAFAQSSVKIYGLMDVGFGSIKTAHTPNTSGGSTQVASGLMTTSFIGFGGSEDLGGGYKAEFVLESFIGVDTGGNIVNNSNGFWGRASSVSLSNASLGKLSFGQYDNPLFTFGYTYNPFGSSMTFSPTMRHYNYIKQMGANALSGAPTGTMPYSGVGFDTGWVNSITYETPSIAGFSGIAQFSPKEGGTSNSYALGGTYATGPLSVSATYLNAGVADDDNGYYAEEKVWALGTSYDFGIAKGFFQYTDITDDTNNVDDSIFQIGASVPVTASGTAMVSYGQLKSKATTTNANSKDKVLSIGYDHTLSKRTDVYAVFMNNSQDGTVATKSGNSLAVGLRHNF